MKHPSLSPSLRVTMLAAVTSRNGVTTLANANAGPRRKFREFSHELPLVASHRRTERGESWAS